MTMRRILLLGATLALTACGPGNNENNTTNNQQTMDMGQSDNSGTTDMGANNGGDDTGTMDPDMGGGGDDDMGGGGNDPAVMLGNPDNCFELGTTPDDVPLALEEVLTAESPMWRRPLAEDMCPAAELTPPDKALVPYVAYKFCNTDSVEHFYDFEWIAQEGPGGEAPLDDPFIVLYDGEELPADHRQCLAANDDIEGAIGTKDSEILGLSIPAGGAVVFVATTFTFEAASDTGVGAGIMIVTNAD